MQSVVVSGNALGAVKPISRDAVASLTADLTPRQVNQPDAPSEFTGGLVAREQGRAVMLATALLAPVPNAPIKGTIVGTVEGVQNVVAGVTQPTEKIGDGRGNTVIGLTNPVGGLTSS